MSETVDVNIDPDLCAASSMCARIAPAIFSLPDDAETAVVLQPSLTDPELIAAADEAAAGCPTEAIAVERRKS